MAERMVGKQAPHFEMEAVMPDKEFGKVSLDEIMKEDKWTVLFFYPMDFTFVCPTEITAMSDRYDEFEDLDAEVVGVSTDTIHTHKAWINTSRDDNGLEQLKYPLAADRKSTRLNSSHVAISYAVFCLKKKNYRRIPNARERTMSATR